MPVQSGSYLGPYEILSAIGAGGMGEVYRARDKRLDRTIAIKVLAPNLSGTTEHRQRFEREARTVGALSLPYRFRIRRAARFARWSVDRLRRQRIRSMGNLYRCLSFLWQPSSGVERRRDGSRMACRR